MKTEKLTPVIKDYIWGGTKLREYGIESDKEKIAEAWVLSAHKDGMSALPDGTPLNQILNSQVLGKNCDRFDFFPLLVKLIDAKDNLSIQVHPDDEYAKIHENSYGKTEMWYIVEAEKDAGLYMGLKDDITKEQLKSHIENGKVESLLNFIKVKKGDCFFIPSGTIHAIGKGCLILEVQQSSNVTYRVFDYNRVGADGKERELHIEKALDVSSLEKYSLQKTEGNTLASCEYFTANLYDLNGNKQISIGRENSFCGVVAVEGSGKIDGKEFKKGDSYFIPANIKAEINGNVKFIEIYIKD